MSGIITLEKQLMEACQMEIQATLKKYGFKLSPSVLITETGLDCRIMLVPSVQDIAAGTVKGSCGIGGVSNGG